MTQGPVLIDLEDHEAPVSVAEAPPVPDMPASKMKGLLITL